MPEGRGLGVRIYEFIHGKDAPFVPGTTDPDPKKQAEFDKEQERLRRQKEQAGGGGVRATTIDDAENKALRTNYAMGGVVRPAHAIHRSPHPQGITYPTAGNAAQPTPEDAAANRMSRQGERVNVVAGANFARGGLVQALHQARAMRRGYAQGGRVVGDAQGGPVVGPGTGTSDSVPINASDGEFVIDAKTTEFFGPEFFTFLQQYAQKMMQDEAGGRGGNQFAELAGDTPGVAVDDN